MPDSQQIVAVCQTSMTVLYVFIESASTNLNPPMLVEVPCKSPTGLAQKVLFQVQRCRLNKNLLKVFLELHKYIVGTGCQARGAGDSAAIHKRRNAADRPARYLPEGLGRNRAIGCPGCLHGHGPKLRIRSSHSSRLRPNAAPKRPQTRSCVHQRANQHRPCRGCGPWPASAAGWGRHLA